MFCLPNAGYQRTPLSNLFFYILSKRRLARWTGMVLSGCWVTTLANTLTDEPDVVVEDDDGEGALYRRNCGCISDLCTQSVIMLHVVLCQPGRGSGTGGRGWRGSAILYSLLLWFKRIIRYL